ncbi:MAG: hypothetical protein EU532_00145 [Promethearchaeota archaeon]|nr:MAG: hypothetical protein EU532_00145 [Candidatus Lokiarchaeota archaeon]
MTSDPNSVDFLLRIAFTIILLITQLLLSVYLLNKILNKKKDTGTVQFDFLFSAFILLVSLSVSLLIFAHFNFNLTHFDPNKYHLYPFVFIWKLASLISLIGFTLVLHVIGKEVFKFRFKGILAYIILLVAIIQFLWPVSEPEDFEFITMLGLVGNIVAVIMTIIFFNMGKRNPGLRIACYLIALGVFVYAIGSALLVETILIQLEIVFGTEIRVFLYALSLSLNTMGLILAIYGVVKFSL